MAMGELAMALKKGRLDTLQFTSANILIDLFCSLKMDEDSELP